MRMRGGVDALLTGEVAPAKPRRQAATRAWILGPNWNKVLQTGAEVAALIGAFAFLVVCADFQSRVGLRTPPAGSGQGYLAASRTV
jgi:hypothetical protein